MTRIEMQPDATLRTPADFLLVTQFRCWMAGYSTRDVSCWEIAWLSLVDAAGIEGAGSLYGRFQSFVRTLLEEAQRDVGWHPVACCRLCSDERTVLALLGASQHGMVVEEGRLAAAVLGHRSGEALVRRSSSLGQSLAAQGLSVGRIGAAEHAGAMDSRRLH